MLEDYNLTYLINTLRDYFVIALFSFLIFWQFFSSLRIAFTSINPLRRDINNLHKVILESVGINRKDKEIYNELNTIVVQKSAYNQRDKIIEHISKSSCIGHLAPSINSNIVGYTGQENIQISTRQLYEDIQFHSIEGNNIPSKKMDQKQTNIISLGVLGTFAGLTIGVTSAGTGLASTDPDVTRQALKELLDGAGIAFFSSLLGLLCAMIYSNYRNRLESKLEISITNLRKMLCSLIPFHDLSIGQHAALTTTIPRSFESIIDHNKSMMERFDALVLPESLNPIIKHNKNMMQRYESINKQSADISNSLKTIKSRIEYMDENNVALLKEICGHSSSIRSIQTELVQVTKKYHVECNEKS